MSKVSSVAVSLGDVLEARAAAAPARPALLAPGGEALTYGDWLVLARDAERTLRAAGIGPDDRLALVLPNGPQMFAVAIAVGTNAVIGPLDPAAREAELERAFAQLGATGVVVPAGRNAARAVAERLALPIVEVHGERSAAASFTLHVTGRPPTGPRRANAAGVFYVARTSGTTGAPKIVALTQQNMLSAATGFAAAFALAPDDRCLLVQPTYHAAALLTLVGTMYAGGSLIAGTAFDPQAFMATLRADEATWTTLPPATYRELIAHLPRTRTLHDRTRLRFLRSGGAPLPHDVHAALEDAYGVPVLQAYGMTEAPSIAVVPYARTRRRLGSVGLPPVGEIAIVDDAGEPVDDLGEIVVRGPHVFGGYDDPAANAAAFFGEWFRTGDLGRRDADGYLYVAGRRKETINRGGQKIFPVEIEEILREEPAIADVAVFGVPHPTLGEEIAAAVILRPDAERTEHDLRRFAAARIADARIPKRILIVEGFPRTANGKVRRGELGAIFRRRTADEGGGLPRTLLEAQLVTIFEQVLERDAVGIDDDFFTCGGDSLRAVRLLAAVGALCRRQPTIQSLFEAPTPRTLAQYIAETTPAPLSPLVRVQAGTKKVPLFFFNGDLDGGGVYVRELARRCDLDRTVYSLAPHGTNGVPSLDSVEEMAADYAAIIQRTFPEGPYLLGGYCNGGIVAYETARRLRAAGAHVAPLFLIASTASNAPFGALRRCVRCVVRGLGGSADDELRWYLRVRARLLDLRGASPVDYGAFLNKQLRALVRRLRGLPRAEAPPHSAAFARMGEILARYEPERYEGTVHHIWGESDAPILTGDPTMGWGYVAASLILHRIPGDHFSIVTQGAEQLAAILRPLFNELG